METKQADNSKGIWKRDPRGVDYVSFTMPEMYVKSSLPTEFTVSRPGYPDIATVIITSSPEILGVIVLMKPKSMYDEEK